MREGEVREGDVRERDVRKRDAREEEVREGEKSLVHPLREGLKLWRRPGNEASAVKCSQSPPVRLSLPAVSYPPSSAAGS